MVVKINVDGSYNIAFSETEQILFNKICTAAVRPPEKIVGNLLWGALVMGSLEVEAVGETKPFNPADLD